LSATKVVVYGLSTEGYLAACQMAIKGADVFIVDESAHMAISLRQK
jgi:UDP-N-acetylmuramoylalanine-D-glutamate ligase